MVCAICQPPVNLPLDPPLGWRAQYNYGHI